MLHQTEDCHMSVHVQIEKQKKGLTEPRSYIQHDAKIRHFRDITEQKLTQQNHTGTNMCKNVITMNTNKARFGCLSSRGRENEMGLSLQS